MKEARENSADQSRQIVSGCLQQGEEPGGFVLMGDDGKVWELTAAGGIMLADHIGHKIKVTGSRIRNSKMLEEKKEKDETKKPAARNVPI